MRLRDCATEGPQPVPAKRLRRLGRNPTRRQQTCAGGHGKARPSVTSIVRLCSPYAQCPGPEASAGGLGAHAQPRGRPGLCRTDLERLWSWDSLSRSPLCTDTESWSWRGLHIPTLQHMSRVPSKCHHLCGSQAGTGPVSQDSARVPWLPTLWFPENTEGQAQGPAQ